MSKHAMNITELKQRSANLRSIREGLKVARTGTDTIEKQHFIDKYSLRIAEELRDVRSVYYARVQEARVKDRLAQQVQELLEPLGWEVTGN